MIVDAKTHTFLTARNIGKMILIEPKLDLSQGLLHITVPAHADTSASTHSISLLPPENPDPDTIHSDLHIWGTQNEGYEVGSQDLVAALSSFMGKDVLLVMKGSELRTAGPEVGWIDAIPDQHVKTTYAEPSSLKWNDQFPILLVSLASYAAVNSLIWKDEQVRKINNFDEERWNETKPGLEVERFRANLIVDGVETAWEEDGWGTLEFNGKAGEKETMFVAARCARCMVSPLVPPPPPDVALRCAYRLTNFHIGRTASKRISLDWSPRQGRTAQRIVSMAKRLVARSWESLLRRQHCTRKESSVTFLVPFLARSLPTHRSGTLTALAGGTIRVGDSVSVLKSYPLVDGLYIRPEDVDA